MSVSPVQAVFRSMSGAGLSRAWLCERSAPGRPFSCHDCGLCQPSLDQDKCALSYRDSFSEWPVKVLKM